MHIRNDYCGFFSVAEISFVTCLCKFVIMDISSKAPLKPSTKMCIVYAEISHNTKLSDFSVVFAAYIG